MNMARFYAMSIETNLFGEACLARRWGRIGEKGQTMIQHFETERDAVAMFLDLLRKKRDAAIQPSCATHGVLLSIAFRGGDEMRIRKEGSISYGGAQRRT